jgi:hypothetical protein
MVASTESSTSRQRLYPTLNNYNTPACLYKLNTPFLTQEVCVFKNLDGTSFGIQCDEVYSGRRQRVEGDIYQRVHLKGVILDADVIQSVKRAIGKLIGIDPQSLPQMIVYGELVCNPGRFRYTDCGFFQIKWLAFGTLFSEHPDKNFASSKELVDKLIASELYAYSIGLKTTIHLNQKLASIFETATEDLICVSFAAKGPLREVCLTQKELMMKNKDLEELIMTGMNGFITKWKTVNEDESNGHRAHRNSVKNIHHVPSD